jgi:hypothetical protein
MKQLGSRSVVCRFEDNEGAVAFLASDIRRIYKVPAESPEDNLLTVIELNPLGPEDDYNSHMVKTQVEVAIAEWERGLEEGWKRAGASLFPLLRARLERGYG